MIYQFAHFRFELPNECLLLLLDFNLRVDDLFERVRHGKCQKTPEERKPVGS
jgi:hypothetical protein